MQEKRECKIVQDLLPNYIENLTNEETNIFINEHLKKCNECKKMLENMKKEVNITDEKIEEREVKSIKKFIRKFKIFRNILIIILCAYLLVVCRRFIIFTVISNKASNFNLDNYYSRIVGIYGKSSNGVIKLQETYHKDSTFLIKTRFLSYPDNVMETIEYMNDKEYLSLTSSGTIYSEITKNASTRNNGIITETTINRGYMDFIHRVIYSFVISIHKVKIDEKDCYLIKENDSEHYIDSDTGMIIKLIYNSANTTFDYYYECDGVTDEDVKKPDTTGYEMSEYNYS